MSSMRYYEGETKKRPGLYNRYSNVGNGINVAGASYGIGAIVISAPWGPVGEVKKFEGTNIATEVALMYGTEGNGAESAQAFISGGLRTVYVYRAGSGGSKSSITLNTAITIEAKYPGKKVFSVQVRESLVDSNKKEMLLLDGTTLLQKFEFASTAQDLYDAITAAGSDYITATVTSAITEVAVATAKAMTAGTDPEVTTESYGNGFSALEPYDYTLITTDSHDTAIQTLLKNYASSAEEYGKRIIAVLGVWEDKDFDEKCSYAKSMDTANVLCVGSGHINANNEEIGKSEDDTRSNAVAAGVIASVPASGSVIHKQIPGATDCIKKLTNAQYEKAIDSGLILYSVGSDGQVWLDSGVTTLINPSAEQDEGWKKIKRVKIRYELMDRLDRTLEPFVGQLNADTAGLNTIIQIGQKVIDAMVKESKLLSGTMTLSKSTSDSGWFDIAVVDVDSLEKIYLHYQYKYSQNA